MGRKKKDVALTPEQKLAQKKEMELFHIKHRVKYLNEPTYHFNVGDEVRYGALKQCVIDEILYDGKVYGMKCIGTDNNYGKPIEFETYRVAAWNEIRPLSVGNTNFSKNQRVMLYFNQSTIEHLLFDYHNFGIEMDPDYQRGYVWSDDDKEALLDSIFNNIDIGKFVLVRLEGEDYERNKMSYEILDGKQRLNTIVEFYENRLSYKGVYYNDLSLEDRYYFKNHHISLAEIDTCDKKTILTHFLMLNQTGRSMDKEHLDKVKAMYDNL